MMLQFFVIALFLFTAPASAALVLADTQASNSASINAGKAGLAWSLGNSANIQQFLTTGKVSWYYTWSPHPVTGAGHAEFVPMLWGAKQIPDWDGSINKTIHDEHVEHVLGFNEPDSSSQGMLSPADAAKLWRAHIQPLHSRGIKLGSPAPTGSPGGKQWLQEFLKECSGCTVDFVAMHWYTTDAKAFVASVEDWHRTFQRPIWVTEWACENFGAGKQCSASEVVEFMQTTRQFMDKNAYVAHYAWFGAMRDLGNVNPANALENKQGVITALGKRYIGAVGLGTMGSMDVLLGAIWRGLEWFCG